MGVLGGVTIFGDYVALGTVDVVVGGGRNRFCGNPFDRDWLILLTILFLWCLRFRGNGVTVVQTWSFPTAWEIVEAGM